jgi:hypothetical protein
VSKVCAECDALQIRSALAAAIQSGAIAYNRGQVDVCAKTYERVARELLQQDLNRALRASANMPKNRAMASRLHGALDESQAAGRNWDRAAQALRHAFDDILQNRLEVNADIGSSLNASAVEEQESPDFFMGTLPNASEGRPSRRAAGRRDQPKACCSVQ